MPIPTLSSQILGGEREPGEVSSEGKIIVVIGVGNPYMKDDAVGQLVVRKFRPVAILF